MFEHAILVLSTIPDEKVRAEKLPPLVFHELDPLPARPTRRAARLPRFLRGRQQTASSRQ